MIPLPQGAGDSSSAGLHPRFLPLSLPPRLFLHQTLLYLELHAFSSSYHVCITCTRLCHVHSRYSTFCCRVICRLLITVEKHSIDGAIPVSSELQPQLKNFLWCGGYYIHFDIHPFEGMLVPQAANSNTFLGFSFLLDLILLA